MKAKRKWPERLLRLLGGLVLAAALALATVSLILAQPQQDETVPAETALPVSPSPAVTVDSEEDLAELIAGFPIPVVSFMSGSGMRFVSATAADTAHGSGFARVATLYWQTPEGEGVMLQSICPADALELLEDPSFHFSSIAGPSLFGTASVRMENEQVIRIHTATAHGLYVFSLPKSLAGSVSGLSRSLQLFTAPGADTE